MLTKIVSGGQTGVDRGALDATLEARFPCGAWCPEGRRAEDGEIPERYPVTVLPGAGYRHHTRRNVMDSDGSLIIYFGELAGGTRETLRFCKRLGKPALAVDGTQASTETAATSAIAFITQHRIGVLNVAGPRESIYARASDHAKRLVGEIIARPTLPENG